MECVIYKIWNLAFLSAIVCKITYVYCGSRKRSPPPPYGFVIVSVYCLILQNHSFHVLCVGNLKRSYWKRWSIQHECILPALLCGRK